jgi:hypothetical protein
MKPLKLFLDAKDILIFGIIGIFLWLIAFLFRFFNVESLMGGGR